MKKLFFIFLLVLGITYSGSTQPTWLKVYGDDSPTEVAVDKIQNSLVCDGEFYYFIQNSQYLSNKPTTTFFYKTTLDGEIVLRKKLSEGFNPNWFSRCNLKLLSDGNLINYGTVQPTYGGVFWDFVQKLTLDGDEIWLNIIEPYAGAGGMIDIEELDDGRILCLGFGYKAFSNIPGKAELFLYSAQGNLIWERIISNPDGFARNPGQTILTIPSTGEILFTSTLGIKGGEFYASVTKLDSLGNVLWDKQYYPVTTSYQLDPMLRLLPDGNLLFGATRDTFGLDIWPGARTIAKIDTSGSIIWELSTNTKSDGVITDVAQTLEGDFVFVGSSHHGVPLSPDYILGANIFKVSSTGELLWERFFVFSDVNQFSRYFTSVVLPPDGGITALGYMSREPTGNQDVFMLHLDENGCLDATCDTVTILTGIFDISPEKQLDFSISPNPTTGAFSLNFSQELGRVDVEIYDGLGRLVDTYFQVSKNETLFLGNKGIYHVALRKKGKLLGSKTVLVK
ncbi:MAG TPA: T9SS type A sorting domain-containing protein [Bacteroidetes bacterium]|nr:T9SS type A sorting domain-containing protein [Bacteroidota bacterium]